jgi:hypothetical protein
MSKSRMSKSRMSNSCSQEMEKAPLSARATDRVPLMDLDTPWSFRSPVTRSVGPFPKLLSIETL